MGHFRRIFRVEGDNSQQPRRNGKTRDILVSYGVEILTDDYFFLLQYTHLQTDKQIELRQQYRTLYYMQLHGINRSFWHAAPHLWNKLLLLFVFLISLVHYHHSDLLRHRALILDWLLTFLITFFALVLKLSFLARHARTNVALMPWAWRPSFCPSLTLMYCLAGFVDTL